MNFCAKIRFFLHLCKTLVKIFAHVKKKHYFCQKLTKQIYIMHDYLSFIVLVEDVALIASVFVWGLNLLFERKYIKRPGEENLPYNPLRWTTGALAIMLFICLSFWLVVNNFPNHIPSYLEYCGNFLDLLCAPLSALVIVQLTHPKPLTKVRILNNILPFIALAVIGCLAYSRIVMLAAFILTAGYLIALMIYSFFQTKRFEVELKDICSSTEGMSLQWLWIAPVMLTMLMIYWLFLSYFNQQIGLLVYFSISIVLWNIIFSRIYQAIVIREHYNNDSQLAHLSDDPKSKKVVESAEETLSNHELKIIDFKTRLQQVCETQKLYLNPELTRDDLARELLMGNSTFTAFLREATGKTFYDYVNQLRVAKALELMNSDMDMNKIYQLVGYRYRSTFNRAFLTHQGCTPSEYRQQLKEKVHLENQDEK